MGTPDDDHDNFCKKAVSSSSKTLAEYGTTVGALSELFGENDGMHGSHLSQDDSCTIVEHNHVRRIDGDTR